MPTREALYVSMPIKRAWGMATKRSEEHTSELQSQSNLVCRLLLEKKKKIVQTYAAPSTPISDRSRVSMDWCIALCSPRLSYALSSGRSSATATTSACALVEAAHAS